MITTFIIEKEKFRRISLNNVINTSLYYLLINCFFSNIWKILIHLKWNFHNTQTLNDGKLN